MSSAIDALRSLAPVVAGALPCAETVGVLSPAEEVEAARLLGSIQSKVAESLALLAADIERRSARELGTSGLAAKNGFKDATGFVQDLVGVRRDEAARLIRVGGLLETAEAVPPLAPPADAGRGDEPPVRSLGALRGVAGSWDAPLGVALKHRWLTAAQSDALRTGLGNPRALELHDAWRAAVLELIEDCWAGHWSPEDLARAAKRMRASLDSAQAAAEARRRYELRSFTRTVRSSGMAHYDIDLDPESDARFYGPIRRLLSPRFGGPRFTSEADKAAAEQVESDPRSNAQLQVDTLLDLIDRAVSNDSGQLFKTREPQVTVAVTADDLRKARGAEDVLRRHHAGDHTACPAAGPGDLGSAKAVADGAGTAGSNENVGDAEMAGSADNAGGTGNAADARSAGSAGRARNSQGAAGAVFGTTACPGPDTGVAFVEGRDEPIAATDALRMICTTGFTPLLFDPSGQTIDLGKDQRFFTARQRRAISVRDGGCMYPGCDRPPGDCEYHQINPWAQHPSHRTSEVRDGILLCRRHHKMVHDHGAKIARNEGTYALIWPGKEAVVLHSKSGARLQLRLRA